MLHTRRQFQFAVAAFLLSLAAPCLRAQNEEVLYAGPFKARTLQGKVLLFLNEGGLSNVLVEECTSDWKTVIQKTYTDSSGHFALADAKIKGVHYIRLSARGMNTTKFKVHVTSSAQATDISVHMSVAT